MSAGRVCQLEAYHEILIALLLIIILRLVFVNSCEFGQSEIVIPKSKIQKSIDEKFPFSEKKILANITIDTPVVYFENETIGLKSTYCGSFLNKKVKGIVDFNGHIICNNEDGSFYLSNFNPVNFTANNSDLSTEEALRSLISSLMNKYLDKYPIYHLDKTKFKGEMAKLLIKDIQTKNDNLVLIVGI